MKGLAYILCLGFLGLAAIAAFCHDGLVEAVAEIFRQLIDLVIAINFDGFLGGVQHDMAFVAPMKMLVEFGFQVLADLAVKVIGQLF